MQDFPKTSAQDSQNRRALDNVFSLTYEELRRLAAAVRRSYPSATLSPTTMVSEAWLKLSRTPQVAGLDPLHFKRIAARAMRQVIISAARKRSAAKRSSGPELLANVEAAAGSAAWQDEELIALDSALEELGAMNSRQAQMVEARFFGGMEMNEIAALLEVSEATVLRDWRIARAWLAGRLNAL